MTDPNDIPLDDRLPDCEPPEETEWDAARREACELLGVDEHFGVLYDRETNPFTLSAMRRRMDEMLEHLQCVNADRHRAENDACDFRAAYETTYTAAKQLQASYDQLLAFYRNLESGIKDSLAGWKKASAERDALQAELVELRRIVHEMKQRPLATAAILVATTLFGRKETNREH